MSSYLSFEWLKLSKRLMPRVILLMILAPLAALLLQLGISRQREYSADETGARMVGQPYGLISALQKLGAYNQRIPTTSLSPSTAAGCAPTSAPTSATIAMSATSASGVP